MSAADHLHPEQFIFGTCGVQHPGVGSCMREPGHELPHENENYERFQFSHEHGQPGYENPDGSHVRTSAEDIADQARMLAQEEERPHQGEDSFRQSPHETLGRIDRVLGYVRD